mmetsp:Transcript_31310/g.70756  ORF Transcript_31310/g.70756 Transcript_31310/m.70756 type:complete len:217 (+) Transcript_31310:310-960(+)
MVAVPHRTHPRPPAPPVDRHCTGRQKAGAPTGPVAATPSTTCSASSAPSPPVSAQLPEPIPSSIFCPPPEGRYTTLRERASVSAMSFAASMRRNSTSAGDISSASETSAADCDSPSARMTAARFSCSAFITRKRARSASCSATCLLSMAAVNSFPNLRSVMATSASSMWNSLARLVSASRTSCETCSRIVMSCSALNWATTAFRTSFPMEGSTRSS